MDDMQRDWERYIARLKRVGAGTYGEKHFMAATHWKFLWAAERIAELEAKLAVFEQPQKWDAVWEKYCQLESIDPDNASGLMEIGASFIYTAGFTEGAALLQDEKG